MAPSDPDRYALGDELAPRSPAHLGRLGLFYLIDGDTDWADVYLRRAVEYGPRYAPAHVGLGAVAERRGELAEAERLYRLAIDLDPGYADARDALAGLCRKQGRYDEAVAAYRAELALRPNLDYVQAGLDYCLRVRRGEVPTAPPPRAVGR